ncbi:8444_t:CDS:2 [Entrophospora sp. SA101]|nr:8444_t:CDS:2 [Entrophospora sp. SA101]
MENFLLNFIPVSAITAVSALYKCVELDGWIGDCEQVIQKFIAISENALRKIPNIDNECAFDDLCSLMEVNALAIDVVDWYEEANENIRSLKCDIGQCKKESAGHSFFN